MQKLLTDVRSATEYLKEAKEQIVLVHKEIEALSNLVATIEATIANIPQKIEGCQQK